MLNAEDGLGERHPLLPWRRPPRWVNDPTWVFPALVVIGLWGIGNAVIINLAGLQGVPTELYDAARVDGAGFWRQLRHVTLPLISPVILYGLTLWTVGVFQYFLVPLVINNGDRRPAARRTSSTSTSTRPSGPSGT